MAAGGKIKERGNSANAIELAVAEPANTCRCLHTRCLERCTHYLAHFPGRTKTNHSAANHSSLIPLVARPKTDRR